MPTPTRSFLDGLDTGVAGLRIGFSPDLGYVYNDPDVDADPDAPDGCLPDHCGPTNTAAT